jgi:hypothetical protein
MALLVLVVIAVARFAAPAVERGEGLRAEATCQKLFTQKEHLEALSWLQQSKPGNIRTLGEQTPEDSRKIVRALYTAGAVDTQVVEIERVAGYGETTNIFCVGLPSSTNERKALFKIEATRGLTQCKMKGRHISFSTNSSCAPGNPYALCSIYKRTSKENRR